MELGDTDMGDPGPGGEESEEPEGSDWEYRLPRLSYSCCKYGHHYLKLIESHQITNLCVVVLCLPVPVEHISVTPEKVIIITD